MTTTMDRSTDQGPKPLFDGRRSHAEQSGVYVFVIVPFLALLAAVPVRLGLGPRLGRRGALRRLLHLTGLGVTVGFHRYFTHGSFKAKRALRIALAVAGCWRAGPAHPLGGRPPPPPRVLRPRGRPALAVALRQRSAALAKGLWYAHMGWMFDREMTNPSASPRTWWPTQDIRRVDELFACWIVDLAAAAGRDRRPGDLVLEGALTAFFWAGLVRIALLHHVTWSINSICHVSASARSTARDQAANFWPLAILSLRRELAQPPPRRPDLRPPRRAARPDRHLAPG